MASTPLVFRTFPAMALPADLPQLPGIPAEWAVGVLAQNGTPFWPNDPFGVAGRIFGPGEFVQTSPILVAGFSTFGLSYVSSLGVNVHCTAILCDPFTSDPIIGIADAEANGFQVGNDSTPANFGVGSGALSALAQKAAVWHTFSLAFVNDDLLQDAQITEIFLFGAARILPV